MSGIIRSSGTIRGSISDTIGINATITTGKFVLNDYVLEVSQIEDGYRLTITKGGDVQIIDFLSMSEEELQIIREAEEGRVTAEELREAAEEARQAAEEARAASEAERVAGEEAREAAEAKREEEFSKLGGVEIGDEPTFEKTVLLLDPDGLDSISIPEIDDASISREDVWSSQKIANELDDMLDIFSFDVLMSEDSRITLSSGKTVAIQGSPTSLDVTFAPPTENEEYLTFLNFRAGNNFSLTETDPDGFVIKWGKEPIFVEGEYYEICYRCLWIREGDNYIISAICR